MSLNPAIGDRTAWPALPYAWFVVGVLLLAYASAFIDRQILALLVDPIRQELLISDTEFSLLAGLAFALFYSTMGVPLAWLADRYSRRLLIMAGIFVWSIMTALCGLAVGFWTLFAARVGVGIGEAVLSPAAYSLIADYFPPERRGRAMAVYSMGAYIGAGLALVIGGAAIGLITNANPVVLPYFGELTPWRTTFLYVGLPGILIALLFLAVREPVRRGQIPAQAPTLTGKAAGSHPQNSMGWFFRTRGGTFLLVALSFSLFGMTPISFLVWIPAFLSRSYGMDPASIGMTYGFILLVFSTIGVALGGWMADRMAMQGKSDSVMRTTLIGTVLATPFAILTPLMPNLTLTLVMLAIASFLFGIPNGMPAAALSLIAPNAVRARVIAIYFLLGSLLTMGLGPLLVALVTDFLLRDSARVGHSLAIVGAVMMPLAILTITAALFAFRRVLQAERENQSGMDLSAAPG